MKTFWNALRRLRVHWKPILIFEIFWKSLTILVMAPAFAGLLQLAIRAAGFRYLTNSNLLQFLKSPWTILLLLVILAVVSLYVLFELAAVCDCFLIPMNPKKPKLRVVLRSMVRAGLGSLKHFFRSGGPLLSLYLLLLIPFMQFSAVSGIFTAMGIPDFLAYYMTKKEFLFPIYVGVAAFCCFLSIRWLFALPLFVRCPCNFRSARKCSRDLVKRKFWRTFGSVLLWNFCYFLLLLFVLAMILVAVLLCIKGFGSGSFLSSNASQILKLLVQIVLGCFSFFAAPIYMAYVLAQLEKRLEERPEVERPSASPKVKKNTRPFHRATAIVTAIVLTLSALGLNVSFFYSLFTGRSTVWLTFYQNPTIMAHRGLSANAPENTLYAFAAAIEADVDFIELDVQQTKDGVLVVLHDQNLVRTTGLNRNIWEVTYAEIQDLDAGSWFDPMYANARISTLEEVLQFVDGRVQLNIEIKPTDYTTDTLEQDVVDLITAYGYEDTCWVTSFSYTSLKKIKQANENIRTGYVMSVAYGQFYNLKYADAFSLNKVFVTNQVVNMAHQYGKEVFAWTVNRVSEARSLYNLHVDGIITDDPEMVQEVVARGSTSETVRTVLDYLLN